MGGTTASSTSLDQDLVELVDALVAAVDLGREGEIARLVSALEPFGGCRLFVDELRLNGSDSAVDCVCRDWL